MAADTCRWRLTELLWGIRWEDHLPLAVTRDVMVVPSSFEQAWPFIEAHYTTIFEDPGTGPFSGRCATRLVERYYRVVGDFFEFKQGERTVALLIGTALDWSTYYMRSAAALPEIQGKQVIQRFLPEMFAVLEAAGVERLEADISPSNMAMLHLLSRVRFNPSGMLLTDRWGALQRFTRFLSEGAERVFIQQFCSGVHYQLKHSSRSWRTGTKGEEP